MEFFQDATISLTPLQHKTVAIIGYGNQGRPQALNLRDSGISVVIGARENSTKHDLAQSDGLPAVSIAAAVAQAEVIMLLLPDETMHQVYQHDIVPALQPSKYLGFGHGMAIHAGWINPRADLNVFLLAPKAQGRGVRNRYVDGSGVPGLAAVAQDPSGHTWDIALAYGKAIGCGRAGILKTTFAAETETDLFSEQTILCGGLTQLIKTGFDVLVEAGYPPEVAYFECLYEVKLIADLLQEGGITSMRDKISSTALFGDISQGANVIDGHVKHTMQHVLANIQSGAFAQAFLADVAQNRAQVHTGVEADSHHLLEQTGRRLREAGILR